MTPDFRACPEEELLGVRKTSENLSKILSFPMSVSTLCLSKASSYLRTSGRCGPGAGTCAPSSEGLLDASLLKQDTHHVEGRFEPGSQWTQIQVVPHSVSHTVTSPRGSADGLYVRVTYTGIFILSEGLAPRAGVSADTCKWHSRVPRATWLVEGRCRA